MKKTLLFVGLLLVATAGFSQESGLPDYSRPTLMRVFSGATVETDQPPLRFDEGALRFDAVGMRWAFQYRPMLPLAGSRPVVSQVLPDAFSLTGTDLATLPHQFRDLRETSEELMRIERLDRRRGRVTLRGGVR